MIRINNFKSCILLLAVVFTFSFQTSAQPDGAQIYKANCTACHMIGGGRLVGPDLQGITEKRTKDWLKNGLIVRQNLLLLVMLMQLKSLKNTINQ
jgi:cytochrome c2